MIGNHYSHLAATVYELQCRQGYLKHVDFECLYWVEMGSFLSMARVLYLHQAEVLDEFRCRLVCTTNKVDGD